MCPSSFMIECRLRTIRKSVDGDWSAGPNAYHGTQQSTEEGESAAGQAAELSAGNDSSSGANIREEVAWLPTSSSGGWSYLLEKLNARPGHEVGGVGQVRDRRVEREHLEPDRAAVNTSAML